MERTDLHSSPQSLIPASNYYLTPFNDRAISMSYTSYSSTERYETARHEAIHALAAVHFGLGVERVDVILGQTSARVAGQTTFRLPIEGYQIMALVRTDP